MLCISTLILLLNLQIYDSLLYEQNKSKYVRCPALTHIFIYTYDKFTLFQNISAKGLFQEKTCTLVSPT